MRFRRSRTTLISFRKGEAKLTPKEDPKTTDKCDDKKDTDKKDIDKKPETESQGSSPPAPARRIGSGE
jgi:hypothetical protein